MQAHSNLMFLSTLKNPCLDLSEAPPRHIPRLLPRILSLIRMIWVNSEYYTTRERITAILRKVCRQLVVLWNLCLSIIIGVYLLLLVCIYYYWWLTIIIGVYLLLLVCIYYYRCIPSIRDYEMLTLSLSL